MGDGGNINLMPEDLRSKESEALVKKKGNFELDLVVPEGLEPKRKAEKVRGPSFWSKFGAMFKSKPKAPKPPKIKKPKKEKHKKVDSVTSVLIEEVKKNGNGKGPGLHVPKVEEKHKDKKEELKQDFSIPKAFEATPKAAETPKQKELEQGPQFHQPEPRIRAKIISEGGGVDLIPQSAKTRSWKQILNLLAVSFVGALIVVGLFYITLFFQEKNKEAKKQLELQQISDLEEQVLNYRGLNEEIEELGKEILLVHSSLSLHFYWTNFFELLEKYTVAEVYYTNLTAGSGGGLTLQAVGKDFDAVARQLKLLQQPEALEFVVFSDISAATLSENGVSFDMTLGLNPFLWYYNEDLINDQDEEIDGEEEGGESEE